jgi:hypothetical protein
MQLRLKKGLNSEGYVREPPRSLETYELCVAPLGVSIISHTHVQISSYLSASLERPRLL